MSTYRQTFQKRNTFLPVIHVAGVAHAHNNAYIAFHNGADGIFLINHEISGGHLAVCYDQVRQAFPEMWIGINFLDVGGFHGKPLQLLRPGMNGMWIDNGGIDEEGLDPTERAQAFARQRRTWEKEWSSSFIYFGGVAFKYLKPVKDPVRAAKLAMPFIDVITTTGEATGIAPSVEKIRSMKEAIGDHPLAIASGSSPENVADYKPYVDAFLMASAITDKSDNLIPERVKAAAEAIHSH